MRKLALVAVELAKQDLKDLEGELDNLVRSITEAEEELARLKRERVNHQKDSVA